MKFFEKVVFKGWQEFQELSTEDKKRYVTLFGHYHFSKWVAQLIVHPLTFLIAAVIGLMLSIGNMLLLHFAETSNIGLIMFCFLFLYLMIFVFAEHCRKKIVKLNEKEFEKWLEKTSEKIQNILFSDFRVVSISKWRHVKKVDQAFYKHLHSDDCRGKCYNCSFKLAKIKNDPKVKIVWISATDMHSRKYGHSVIEKEGRILDTNTRKSYNKVKYLNAQKAEIFKEYVLEEYQKVESLGI